MPRNQRQQLQDHSPLLYSSLTTRNSSYPIWVLVVSSPFPHVIRRTELGDEVPQLLLSSNRGLVCESHGDNHILPIDAHLKILQVCYTVLLHYFYTDTVWESAEAAIMAHLPERWGGKIHIEGFQHVLQDGYYYIQHLFGSGYLYFPTTVCTYGILFE